MLKSKIRSQMMAFCGLMFFWSIDASASLLTCNTTAECKALRDQQDARIAELRVRPQPASFLEIARNEDGRAKFMTQHEAVEYCALQGAHLPNARELAQILVSQGARGIVDSCDGDNDCYRVRVKNADGNQDEFYFSAVGHRLPQRDQQRWFWSSSINIKDSEFALYLRVNDAHLDANGYRIDTNAVRCVVRR